MIDIVTIYLIFSAPHNFNFNKIIKRSKVKKDKKDKKKKNKTKNNLVLKNNSIDKIKNVDNNKDNNSIEVYDENKSVSLNTFQ
jgi:hypothetical protein